MSAAVKRAPAACTGLASSPATDTARATMRWLMARTPVFEHDGAYTAAMLLMRIVQFRRAARVLFALCLAGALAPLPVRAAALATLLLPARVFDGTTMHSGWQVLVSGDRIIAVGASVPAPPDARRIDLAGT